MTLYNITDWLGLVPIFVCMIFGFVGLAQLIKRRSLLKVDFDLPDLQDMGVPAFEGSDIDIDSFFEDAEQKDKKPKTVVCPHCGEEFEI